jgi:hypothetical protein
MAAMEGKTIEFVITKTETKAHFRISFDYGSTGVIY